MRRGVGDRITDAVASVRVTENGRSQRVSRIREAHECGQIGVAASAFQGDQRPLADVRARGEGVQRQSRGRTRGVDVPSDDFDGGFVHSRSPYCTLRSF